MVSWDASERAWPAGQGRWSLPPALPWWGHICSTVSSSGLPSSIKTGNCWREPSRGAQRWLGAWSIALWGNLRLPSLEERRPRRDLINAYKYLKGRTQVDEKRLFSAVPSDRTRSNRHKLEYRKFHTNMKKKLFTVRVREHWTGCPDMLWRLIF